MGCFSGGGGVDYVAPSSNEEALRASALGAVNKSSSLTDALLPTILQKQGLVNAGLTTSQKYQDINAQYQDLYKKYQAMIDAQPDTRVLWSDPEYLKVEKQIKGLEDQMAGMRSTYRPMTDDEYYNSLSGLDKLQYDVSKAQADRTLKALNGELPISPALEKNLTRNEESLAEALARQNGPNWQSGNAGQRMTDLKESNELVREEARRGEISQGTQNLLADLGYIQNSTTQDANTLTGTTSSYLPLVSAYNTLQQPYQYDRSMQFQTNQINAQNDANSVAGNKALLGSLIGMGAGAVTAGMGGGTTAGAGTGSAFFNSALYNKIGNGFSYLRS